MRSVTPLNGLSFPVSRRAGRMSTAYEPSWKSQHEEETFPVGDEVICAHCSLTGAVAATNGPDAPSFWSCRGKSVEHLDETTHVDRQ